MDAVGVYCHKHPINVKIMKKVSYVFLADGFEEVEALTPVDVLRRGECTVVTVSVTGRREVTGSHGIPVVADALFEDLSFDDAQWLILPGGMPGAKSLYEFEPLQELLKKRQLQKMDALRLSVHPPEWCLVSSDCLRVRPQPVIPVLRG